nr:immunoglobulin heavy chain junction region [Mus musculus]
CARMLTGTAMDYW